MRRSQSAWMAKRGRVEIIFFEWQIRTWAEKGFCSSFSSSCAELGSSSWLVSLPSRRTRKESTAFGSMTRAKYNHPPAGYGGL